MRTNLPPDTLEELAEDWLIAKQAEKNANYRRLEVEEALLGLLGANADEGTFNRKLRNGLRIKARYSLNYKGDYELINPLVQGWDVNERPFKTVVDEAALKRIRNDSPERWKRIAIGVTVKPAKTSITIESEE